MPDGGSLTPFLSAVVGAVTGGALTGVVSWLTLRESHRLEREAKRSDARGEACSRVAAELLRTLNRLPEVVSDAGEQAAQALQDLDEALVEASAALTGSELEARINKARDLLAQDPKLAGRQEGLKELEVGRVSARLAADRRNYTEWVLACLVAVAAGRKAPTDVPPPADSTDPQAAAWEAPTTSGRT